MNNWYTGFPGCQDSKIPGFFPSRIGYVQVLHHSRQQFPQLGTINQHYRNAGAGVVIPDSLKQHVTRQRRRILNHIFEYRSSFVVKPLVLRKRDVSTQRAIDGESGLRSMSEKSGNKRPVDSPRPPQVVLRETDIGDTMGQGPSSNQADLRPKQSET